MKLVKSIFSLSCAIFQVTTLSSDLVSEVIAKKKFALSFLKKSGYSDRAGVSKKSHDQGDEGTCYAYSVATVIRAARERLRKWQERKGQKQSHVPSHKGLVKRIIKNYGTDGASTKQVLKYYAPKFGLKYDLITFDEAEMAVSSYGRPLVYDYYPDSKQWNAFERYFKNNPDGILSKRRVDEARDRGYFTDGAGEGHSVVITGINDNGTYKYWKCKNSWSGDFADGGYFRFSCDAFDDCPVEERFIDVYSEKCDKRMKYTSRSGRGKRNNGYAQSSESEGITTDESGYGTDQTQS